MGETDGGCHEGDTVGSTVGLEVMGELEEIVGSDDGILVGGKSLGLTDGIDVGKFDEIVGCDDGIIVGKTITEGFAGARDGVSDGAVEGLIEGDNVELVGTRVKAVGCHDGDTVRSTVVVGDEIAGCDDGIMVGKSVGLTEGLGVVARDGVSDGTVEGLIEGDNVELVGTRVKAVGAALGTCKGDDDGLRDETVGSTVGLEVVGE